MACEHKNIRVYEEVTYRGTLVDGAVYFDSCKPLHVDTQSAVCLDCDEEFDEILNEEE